MAGGASRIGAGMEFWHLARDLNLHLAKYSLEKTYSEAEGARLSLRRLGRVGIPRAVPVVEALPIGVKSVLLEPPAALSFPPTYQVPSERGGVDPLLLAVHRHSVEDLHVPRVQVNDFEVGLDAGLGDGLREDDDATVDLVRDKDGRWGDVVLFRDRGCCPRGWSACVPGRRAGNNSPSSGSASRGESV